MIYIKVTVVMPITADDVAKKEKNGQLIDRIIGIINIIVSITSISVAILNRMA